MPNMRRVHHVPVNNTCIPKIQNVNVTLHDIEVQTCQYERKILRSKIDQTRYLEKQGLGKESFGVGTRALW